MTSIGQLGEEFVAQWLLAQGWQILQQRWRSPWGEIDLIAQHYNPSLVAFVEVKTRQSRNWDHGGVFAITSQKQAKIRQTADYFLGEYPQFADVPCRFDVALVHYKPCKKTSLILENLTIKIGESIQWQSYQLTLLDYIEAAF
ncbi:YraN family protein [Crocosphaera sp. XPORK-15E]|uniref:YraN family protein n=1 Tax=Crocosphaera sp. XPORK-15E TaxID=3110247 RepID=UPI002B202D44|nr:YraN family protein [Crocosphaera sp. XPORK-15E]MEA5532875.1 YraN family protein [Crocosphaera sp. XPORK-15E]